MKRNMHLCDMLDVMKRNEHIFDRIGTFLFVHFSVRYSRDEIVKNLRTYVARCRFVEFSSVVSLSLETHTHTHKQKSIRRRTVPALSAFGISEDECVHLCFVMKGRSFSETTTKA